jgi:hypothetical protein
MDWNAGHKVWLLPTVPFEFQEDISLDTTEWFDNCI